jgi:murein DD-endopeptidase MepM/ murein hydrolase activator NlpD
LARFNGIALDTPLRRDEVVALPTRVTEPSPATGAATTGPILPLDVAEVATTALDRVGEQPAVTTRPLAPAAAPAGTGTEPIRHQVQRGETAFSISRLYDVPVRNIADWNSLSSDLAVREGQQLLIPQGGAPAPAPAAPAPVEEPGTGSVTPLPPSASAPLPVDDTSPAVPAPEAPEAPDLGTPSVPPPAAPTASTVDARFAYPVQGSIIRAYAPGRNEGIDIGVPAGTPVKAAGAGTVAAVTTDTQGVAIVVIKHPDNLLTVYTNIDNLTVAKDASVRGGQTIGEVRAGSPSFLHFEVRRGLQSVDPADFLP